MTILFFSNNFEIFIFTILKWVLQSKQTLHLQLENHYNLYVITICYHCLATGIFSIFHISSKNSVVQKLIWWSWVLKWMCFSWSPPIHVPHRSGEMHFVLALFNEVLSKSFSFLFMLAARLSPAVLPVLSSISPSKIFVVLIGLWMSFWILFCFIINWTTVSLSVPSKFSARDKNSAFSLAESLCPYCPKEKQVTTMYFIC